MPPTSLTVFSTQLAGTQTAPRIGASGNVKRPIKHLHAPQDAQRAIRLVRSRAGELKIGPHKIGVIGFSAGGYVVAQTSNILEAAYEPVDETDTGSSRPDFAIAMFPGHLCRARFL